MGLYAYCIVDIATEIDSATDLRAVDAGAVRAVVRAVDVADYEGERLEAHLQDPSWLEAAVRDHESVVERFLPSGAVVPMQFGSIFSRVESLDAMLDANGEQFRDLLDRVRGKAEWGVKLRIDLAAAARDLTPASAPTGGRAFLERRRDEHQAVERAAEAAATAADDVHRLLADVADDAATLVLRGSSGAGTVVLNGTYLVPGADEDRFARRVEDLRHELGRAYHLDLSGPWPPYTFTTADVAGPR